MSWYYGNITGTDWRGTTHIVGRIDIRTTLISQNVSANTSYVRVEAWITSQAESISSNTGYTNANGSSQYHNVYWGLQSGQSFTMLDTYITVYHNSAGAGSGSYSATGWTGYASTSSANFDTTCSLYFTESYPSLARVPTVTTNSVTTITTSSAKCYGNVTWGGNSTVTTRGICYSTSSNPTISNSKVSSGSGTGSFSSTISGLSAGTKYYFRAYATNSVGTSYGSTWSFDTLKAPTVATYAATNVASSTATLKGSMSYNGNPTITEKGFCYSNTTSTPTTSNIKKTVSGTTTGSYSYNAYSLTAGETYYFRAYAKNSVGTSYGTVYSFKTEGKPSVSTTSVSNIHSTYATGYGNATSDNGSSITQRGLCWSTSSNPTTSSSKVTSGSGTGSFSGTLSSLTPGTTYYCRAYAINSVGTTYGVNKSFVTLKAPTVTTSATTSIHGTSATCNGSMSINGIPVITEKGFVYSTSSNPTTSSSKKIVSGTSTGSYNAVITGLAIDTTYYVRAYAINSVGTVYGDNSSFKTATTPSVTSESATNIHATTVYTQGNVTSDGRDTVTTRGICYSTSSNPTTSSSKVASGSGTGEYSTTLTSLTPDTTYYYRAYATNSAGTAYSTEYSFTTDHSTSIIGTFYISATISSKTTFNRSISGGFVMDATVYAAVKKDPANIEKKTYLYKVYDEDNNFVSILDDVISEPDWSEEINTSGSSFFIELARNSDSAVTALTILQADDGSSIEDNFGYGINVTTDSRNKIGPGSNVSHNYRVDIFIFYGEVSVLQTNLSQDIQDNFGNALEATLGSPNGLRKFTGFISEIDSRYGDTETTIVQLTSYGYDLDQILIEDGGYTSVAFNSYDPSDIIRDGLDQFKTLGDGDTFTDYSDLSIDDTSETVSYTFRANTYKELLEKTVQLAPNGWYYHVGLGDNLVYFKKKSDTPEHTFILGKHIQSLDVRSYIGSVVNDVLFIGGGDPAVFRRTTRTPQTGTRRGLSKMSDSRVEITSSADILATGELDQNENIQYRSTVKIVDKVYDIESISVGDVIGFSNFDNYVDDITMQVVGLKYTPDMVTLQLDSLPASVPKRLEDIKRALNTTETITVPDTPVDV